jgi:probable rRNA maturation factor
MGDGTVPRPRASASSLVVLVSNRQDLPVDLAGLAALAERVLLAEGLTGGELSLSFVDLEEMSGLHERYAEEPGPTDVLSFPMDDEGLLGDVVVCPAEAVRSNPDLSAELRLLVVHGVLHLLGYDHQSDQDRAAMWAKQDAYRGSWP